MRAERFWETGNFPLPDFQETRDVIREFTNLPEFQDRDAFFLNS